MTEIRPLRAYAEVVLGRQRSPATDTGPHMVPYLRAANVKDGVLDLDDVKEMNFNPKEQSVFALRPGDVLVTEGSGSLTAVGASSVWQGELPGTVCFQNTLLRLRPRPSTDPRYLAWWCRHAFADGLFASAATGANIFHVSADRVRSLPMTYLPLETQSAIADRLDADTARIDALIELKRRQIVLLEQRSRQNLANLACGRSLGSPLIQSQHDWLGSIPVHWNVERLKYAARLESGHTPSKTHPELWENCTTPWVTLSDVGYLATHEFIDKTVNLISEEGLAASSARVLPAGTVILSRDATVGRCGILAEPMATSQHFVDWICSARLRPRYLWLLFRTAMQTHFDSLTAGATLKTIGMPDVKRLVVPVPPVGEQDRIIAEAERLGASADAVVSALHRQIDLLVEHRQALITAAVTGELDIPGVAA